MANETDRPIEAYKPINPNESYNRDNLREAMKGVSKLEGLLAGLKENANNPTVMKGLGKTLLDDPTFYANVRNPALNATENAEQARDGGIQAVSEYVGKNLNSVLQELDDNDYLTLVHSLPLVETGDERSDKAVKALKKAREANEAKQDPIKAQEYLKRKLENMPGWFLRAYNFSGGVEGYIPGLLSVFTSDDSGKADEAISREVEVDGKKKKEIDKEFVKSLFERSLMKVKDEDEDKAGMYYEVIARLIARKKA